MDFLFNDHAINEYGGNPAPFDIIDVVLTILDFKTADVQRFVDDVESCFRTYQQETNADSVPLRQVFKELMTESFGDAITVQIHFVCLIYHLTRPLF
jgi:hypothetical protein